MNKFIIDTGKMSPLGKEFVELALFIVDYKDLQAHNKNLVKHIPGGRYAQCPVKEIEQEIGHRTSQLPLVTQRALTSLWADNYGLPMFQHWFIKHTIKHPRDTDALSKLWHELCFKKLPWNIRASFCDCEVDELQYNPNDDGGAKFKQRNLNEVALFRHRVFRYSLLA